MLDLHAEIADLLPSERGFETLAAHPSAHGEHAGGTGLVRGDERNEGVSEMDDVPHGLVRRAGSGDGEIFQTDDAVFVLMHRFEA